MSDWTWILVPLLATAAGAVVVRQYFRVPHDQREKRIRLVADDILEFVRKNPGEWRMKVERHVHRNSADVRQAVDLLLSESRLHAVKVGRGFRLYPTDA